MSKQYPDRIPVSSNNPEYNKMYSGFAEELEKLGEVEEKTEVKCECECPPPPAPPKPPKKKPLKMTANLAHTLDDLRDKYIEVHYIYLYGETGTLTKSELEQVTETKANYLVLDDNEIFELASADTINHKYTYSLIVGDENNTTLKIAILNTLTGDYQIKNINLDVADKEDKIKYINLYETEGILTEEQLSILLNNRLNKIIFNNTYYSLAFKDGVTRRYTTDILYKGKIQYININGLTGEYKYEQIINEILENHIKNDSIHVSEYDRDFWNNKVTATIEETIEGNKLILTKEKL